MKIYVLMEDTSYQQEFYAEHGLSLYVETQNHKLLFDTGQTDLFVENAQKLGVDLSKVDIAFLSHGHYDHSGGLKRFLELNDHANVYLSRHAFGEYYHGEERYIGIDKELSKSSRLIYTGEELVIDEELSLCSCNGNKQTYPIDSAGLTEKADDGYKPDQFWHEQYLTIKDNDQRILLSGCSHKGVLNIMEWLHPDVFVGGFHFIKQDVSDGKNETLDCAADILCGYNTKYYTCHCTGTSQYAYLKEKMGDKVQYIAAGQVIEL